MVEEAHGDEWRLVDRPITVASDDLDELVESKVVGYDLDETGLPWRVRVYAGYNSFDELVAERRRAESRP
jgi:hypothetical protein